MLKWCETVYTKKSFMFAVLSRRTFYKNVAKNIIKYRDRETLVTEIILLTKYVKTWIYLYGISEKKLFCEKK